MALDEPTNLDYTYRIKNFLFVVDKKLMSHLNEVEIDFVKYGFTVKSKNFAESTDCGGRSCKSQEEKCSS